MVAETSLLKLFICAFTFARLLDFLSDDLTEKNIRSDRINRATETTILSMFPPPKAKSSSSQHKMRLLYLLSFQELSFCFS